MEKMKDDNDSLFDWVERCRKKLGLDNCPENHLYGFLLEAYTEIERLQEKKVSVQIVHLGGTKDKFTECGIEIKKGVEIVDGIGMVNCKACLEITHYGGRY